MEWLPPPRTVDLLDNTVHVWLADLNVGQVFYDACYNFLNRDECHRALRYQFEPPRRRFVITRAVLRRLAGLYTRTSPEAVSITHQGWGKPVLNSIHGQHLEFNVSHSQDMALLAFSRNRPLGIDVEYIAPISNVANLVATFFSENENAQFQAVAPALQLQAFFTGWTRKEAYSKGRGKGLSLSMRAFDVAIHPEVPAVLIEDRTDSTAAKHWTLMDIKIDCGYVASLAVGGGILPAFEVVGYRLDSACDVDNLVLRQ